MAIIRRDTSAQPTRRAEVDPFRLMDQLLGWDPFRAADPFRAMVPVAEARSFQPSFDVRESKDAFVFKADLPGVKESELEISLNATLLTISGRRDEEKKEEGDTWFAYERSHGTFSRSFTLPESADGEHARADMKDGVLTLVVPKKPELKPRKITVNVNAESARH